MLRATVLFALIVPSLPTPLPLPIGPPISPPVWAVDGNSAVGHLLGNSEGEPGEWTRVHTDWDGQDKPFAPVQVAAGGRWAWAINDRGDMFRLEEPYKGIWAAVNLAGMDYKSGHAWSLDCSSEEVFIATIKGEIYRRPLDAGRNWTRVEPRVSKAGARHVCGTYGTIWAVDWEYNLYYYFDFPGNWTKTNVISGGDGLHWLVKCSQDEAWVTTRTGQIFRREINAGGAWHRVLGPGPEVTHASAGSGWLWAVRDWTEVYFSVAPYNGTWVHQATYNLEQISVQQQ